MKKNKHSITKEEAKELIPHCAWYCNDNGNCPFWYLRKLHSKRKYLKIVKKNGIIGVPSYYEKNHTLEYCSYLKRYLLYQDGIKECNINVDIDYDN